MSRFPPGAILGMALADLRGGFRGFAVMVACLALGVGAMAGIGSVSESLHEGLKREGQTLLGGDLDLRLTHRPADAEQKAWLAERGVLSEILVMRSMATADRPQAPAPGQRVMVELKAVDGAYPLYGTVETSPPMPLARALALDDDGAFGAIVESGLLARLGLEQGQTFRLGEARFRIHAMLDREPDLAGEGLKLGPRVLIGREGLEASGLIQPGSLIRYHLRLKLDDPGETARLAAAIEARFPDAGWRLRTPENATPQLSRFIDRGTLFFTLISLAALLVGGVGIAGAVRGHLDSRRATIATLKCLGAPSSAIATIYGIQIGLMALTGIGLGLASGALVAVLAMPLAGTMVPVAVSPGLHPAPLALAALFGGAVALAFTLWPLAQARAIPAAALIRSRVVLRPFTLPPAYALAMALTAALLVLLVWRIAGRADLALGFLGGTIGAMGLILVLGLLFRLAARKLSTALAAPGRARLQSGRLALALANIHRPGGPALIVLLALGIGLSLFVALVQVENGFARALDDQLPAEAPSHFFIDLQPDQVEAFDALIAGWPGVEPLTRMATLRGRIVRAGGTPISEIVVAENARWALRGDRGLTFSGAMPEGTRLVEGNWWAEDYRGPPLISVDATIARGMGLGLGDSITLNILGREITATIHNLREIAWGSFGLNFTFIFSPGVLEAAPLTHIATLQATPDSEEALLAAIASRFENVTAIRVRDALDLVTATLDTLGAAARAAAALTLITGALVLAGALAAGRRERNRDAVILKITGARRADLALAYLYEYGLYALAASLFATLVGSLAAWLVLHRLLSLDWAFAAAPVVVTLAAAGAGIILLGFAGTWRALTQSPASALRAG